MNFGGLLVDKLASFMF